MKWIGILFTQDNIDKYKSILKLLNYFMNKLNSEQISKSSYTV